MVVYRYASCSLCELLPGTARFKVQWRPLSPIAQRVPEVLAGGTGGISFRTVQGRMQSVIQKTFGGTSGKKGSFHIVSTGRQISLPVNIVI